MPCHVMVPRAMPFFWSHGSFLGAHDSKKKLPRGPKKRPMTLEKSGAIFLGKKKRLRQRRGSSRASRNMGPFFWKKKSTCGNVGGHLGLPVVSCRRDESKCHQVCIFPDQYERRPPSLIFQGPLPRPLEPLIASSVWGMTNVLPKLFFPKLSTF